jgi:hypothetical protein
MLRRRPALVHLPLDTDGFGFTQSFAEPRQLRCCQITLLALFLEALDLARRVVTSRHLLGPPGPIEHHAQQRGATIGSRRRIFADAPVQTNNIGVRHIARTLRAEHRVYELGEVILE